MCETCYDEPSAFLRAIILPPDPVPILNARPENYALDENDARVTEDSQQRITEDGQNRAVDGSANPNVGNPSP